MGNTRAKPIDASLVKELFDYVDGGLVWRVNKGRAKVGMKAHTNSTGYKLFRINQQNYLEHRLIWAWHYGDVPEYLDHINGNYLDNRIENLREATHAENMRNRKTPSHNKSGVKGVYMTKGKWRSQVTINGKVKHLGSFDDLQEAAAAVETARTKYHASFANSGT